MKRYYVLGIFVLSGLALVIAVILLLGVGAFWRETVRMETYVDDTIQGLDLGSPIKQRGVKLGVVSEVDFVRNIYQFPESSGWQQGSGQEEAGEREDEEAGRQRDGQAANVYSRYVLVRFNLSARGRELARDIDEQVKAGLRVRIVPQGVTGLSYVDLDYLDPELYPVPEIAWEPEYPYIPSAPGALRLVTTALESLARELRPTEMRALVKDINQLVLLLSSEIEASNVPQLSRRVDATLADISRTSGALRKLAEGGDANIRARRIDNILANVEQASFSIRHIISDNQGLLSEAIRNFATASRNLQEVSETARNYPSFIFFGDPPSSPNPRQ